jgi:hypothetical protein
MISSAVDSITGAFNSGSFGELVSHHALPAAALAGGLGASIGADVDQDNPGRGAVVGGAVGAGAIAALKSRAIWKAIGPVGRLGAITLGTLGIVGAGAYFGDKSQSAVQDEAEPTLPGEYRATASSGVKDRLAMINASGGITLGLHNSR